MVAEKSIHFRFEGSLYLTTNHTLIIHHVGIPDDFHVMQDFLTQSCIGYCLKEPITISAKAVRQIWATVSFNNSGENAQPKIDFKYDGVVYHITPTIVRQALKLPDMRSMMTWKMMK